MSDKCNHCNVNITKKVRPGVKCVRCTIWIHRSCAQLPDGHQIWTCSKCKQARNSLMNRRRSSILSTGNVASSSSSSQSDVGNMVKEVENLKSTNTRILEMLNTLNDKMQMLEECKVEIAQLKGMNQRLITENQKLKDEIRNKVSKQKTADVRIVEGNTDMASLKKVGESSKRGNIQSRPVNQLSSPKNSSPLFSSSKFLSAAPSIKYIYVTNLHSEATNEDVVSHVSSHSAIDRNLLSCSSLTPRSITTPFFTSFKVGVPESFFNQVVDQTFWPQNSQVREFNIQQANFRVDHQRKTLS